MADDTGWRWMNGTISPTTIIWPDWNSQTVMVDEESQCLAAFEIADIGEVAGFAAAVYINDVAIAQTGENSGWKASYTLNANLDSSSGWNSLLSLNDSAWKNLNSVNECSATWSGVDAVKVVGAYANVTWGPTAFNLSFVSY